MARLGVDSAQTATQAQTLARIDSGPPMKSSTTAHRIGTVAIECRLHPYGVYLQEMLKSIEEQWHQLATGFYSFAKSPHAGYRHLSLHSSALG